MCAFVSQQRFAKKFTHFSVDLAGAEIVVIEKDLEASSGDFVVVGQSHECFLFRSERFRRGRHKRQNLGWFLRERRPAEPAKACQQPSTPKPELGNEVREPEKLHWRK